MLYFPFYIGLLHDISRFLRVEILTTIQHYLLGLKPINRGIYTFHVDKLTICHLKQQELIYV